jgi:Tfp pilus assembly protein PilV
MAPKVKLLNLSVKKTIIVKTSLKDMQLDTIPKTMEARHIVPRSTVGDKMMQKMNMMKMKEPTWLLHMMTTI